MKLCFSQGHPEVDRLRSSHLQWLMDTKQEEKAGEVRVTFLSENLMSHNFLSPPIWSLCTKAQKVTLAGCLMCFDLLETEL